MHAARLFLQHAEPTAVTVKLDFCNAFNSIRRDKMLECVQDLAPDLSAYVHSGQTGSKWSHGREGSLWSGMLHVQTRLLAPMLQLLQGSQGRWQH